MRIYQRISILLLLAIFCTISIAESTNRLDQFREGDIIAGFKVENVYTNDADVRIGARFQSIKHSFILDLLPIQSVPQAFIWVNTRTSSEKGEPHSIEHLVLGKGKKGKIISVFEDMTLATSTAYTSQLYTAYHFNTNADTGSFYRLFDLKLDALLHPDFSDAEQVREDYHLGVSIDSKTGKRVLEEKGTIYTEMLSAFEKPNSLLFQMANYHIYGKDHPLSSETGGYPPANRTMTTDDIRRFHSDNYRLDKMGAIVALPADVPIEASLSRLSEILDRIEPNGHTGIVNGMTKPNLPTIHPASPSGKLIPVEYPSDNPNDRCEVYFLYPADNEFSFDTYLLMQYFINSFVNSQSSPLHQKIIGSKTRVIETGAASVSGYINSDPGNSLGFIFTGIARNKINQTMIDSLRLIVSTELQRLSSYPDGSPELIEFNKDVLSRIQQFRKGIRYYLNSPPGFGERGGGGASNWYYYLSQLEKSSNSFSKSLAMKSDIDALEAKVKSGKNIWRSLIDRSKLLKRPPFAFASVPNTTLAKTAVAEKEARLAKALNKLKSKYHASSTDSALVLFERDYNETTKQIDQQYVGLKLPKFVENPPLTPDPLLNYETIKLSNGVPVVASTFDNITSITTGLSLRLSVIPESLLFYVPLLPSIINQIGVVDNGKPVSYEEMEKRLHEEVLHFGASLDVSEVADRFELLLTGMGGNRTEFENSAKWMELGLTSPYLAHENLPRIRDVIDEELDGLRNSMTGKEENWVRNPSISYYLQNKPLFLVCNSFLTQKACMFRLKCRFTEIEKSQARSEVYQYLDDLISHSAGMSRENLTTLLDRSEPKQLTSSASDIIKILSKELGSMIGDLPTETAASDFIALCQLVKSDLAYGPDRTLADFRQILASLRNSGNARMYLVSSRIDREAMLPKIEHLVSCLENKQPIEQHYSNIRRIEQRICDRNPGLKKPVYVGLLNENSRNGVLMLTCKLTAPWDSSREAAMDYLTGGLFGGSGAHGLFMKTWGSGLAYSNGFRIGESKGRASYYAERCPDIAATIRFVADYLKASKTAVDSSLSDYIVAQYFVDSQAADRYESRGYKIAANLADGITPERVASFRKQILTVSKTPNLIPELYKRIDRVYGSVIVGMGNSKVNAVDPNFFVIGPKTQFESLATEIAKFEPNLPVYTVYPSDYWLRP